MVDGDSPRVELQNLEMEIFVLQVGERWSLLETLGASVVVQGLSRGDIRSLCT